MRVAIMQPYFFPYLGHFGLLSQADLWVVFDLTQYTPKSWMNRNRVLHPRKDWMYITLPLSNSSRNMTIREAKVLNRTDAHRTILGKLSHYRKKAPFFQEVAQIVNRSFAKMYDDSLVHCDVAALAAVCEYLNLGFPYRICSELKLDLPPVAHPGGWAPAVAHALGATEYLNPLSGQRLFAPQDFQKRGIALKFFDMPEFVYRTGPYGFEPGLSILDVLMWNSPEATLEHIHANSRLATA